MDAWYAKISDDFSRNLVERTAAIITNFSDHWIVLYWWRSTDVYPGVLVGMSSKAISDISKYPRSRIFLTIHGGRVAVGFYGPLFDRLHALYPAAAGKVLPARAGPCPALTL